MIDGIGRNIDYLRISLTDKCNLRCQYCMPKEGIHQIAHEEVLTLEEVERLAGIFAELGIRKIRLTGGEPLVRKNIVGLIRKLKQIPGIEDVTITTNGVLLEKMADELSDAGIRNINISLDTLKPDVFEEITGFPFLSQVLSGIEKAEKLGMNVKINCVPCKEWNEDELVSIAGLAKEKNIYVRFIELMPVGCGKYFHGIASDEVLRKLEEKYGKSERYEVQELKGPASYVSFKDWSGKVGFISPISHKFCTECNRVRLTAEGRLKLCLQYEKGIELKPLLRGGKNDEEIRTEIEKAIMGKPKAHDFLGTEKIEGPFDERKMAQIGG